MIQRETLNSFFYSLFGFRKTRNKLHIVAIVLVHLSAWVLLFLLPMLTYPFRISGSGFFRIELVDKLMLIVIFYANYYFFIPYFFEKKRYVIYAVSIVVAFVLYLTIMLNIRLQNFYEREATFNPVPAFAIPASIKDSFAPPPLLTNFEEAIVEPAPYPRLGFRMKGRRSDRDTLMRVFTNAVLSSRETIFGIPRPHAAVVLNRSTSSFLLILLIAGFIRLAYSFVRNQNEKKALENAKLNAEVNFLKSQINPHFLFNTLNSIYSQAHARSDNTEFSILKLSELLRYVLYETAAERVPLENDIQYISNYIDLQRLRLSNRVKLDYRVQGDLKGKAIAPMLLISFIENAFKHGISYSAPSTIKIDLQVQDEILWLGVSNPIVEKDISNKRNSGGLGIRNVTRRLELLYPERYELRIVQEEMQHIVHLNLNLTHA